MTRYIAITAACFLATAPEGRAAEGEELAPALKKAAGWENYRFTVESRPGPGTQGALEGRYQKGRPLACKADNIEFFKQGEALVYLDGGRWLRSKRGTLSDPLRVLGGVAKVNAVRLPHEEATVLAKVVRSVKKAERKEGGHTVFNGDLDAEAARSLVGTEHRAVARGGTARFWVNGDGSLVKYTVDLRVQGRLGGAEIDGNVVRTVTLTGAGDTKVEVPEAARKALE
jgi:hypothetical protein